MDKLSERFMYYCGLLAGRRSNPKIKVDDLRHIQDLMDAEEQGLLLKLPFGLGTPIYKVCYASQINDGFIYETTMSLKFYAYNISEFEEGLVYSDKEEAEQALQRMKEGAE